MHSAMAKLGAIERELKYRRHVYPRRRVYPRQIAAGKITDGFAAAEISVLEEIAEDYRKIVEKERLT